MLLYLQKHTLKKKDVKLIQTIKFLDLDRFAFKN